MRLNDYDYILFGVRQLCDCPALLEIVHHDLWPLFVLNLGPAHEQDCIAAEVRGHAQQIRDAISDVLGLIERS